MLQSTLDFLAARNSAVGRHLLLQSTVGPSTNVRKKPSPVCRGMISQGGDSLENDPAGPNGRGRSSWFLAVVGSNPPPLLGPNWDQSAQTCCEADFGSRIKILGHPLGQSASFFEIYPFRLGSLWGHVGVRNKSRAPQGSPRIQTGLPPHPNISKWLSSHFEFRRPWGGGCEAPLSPGTNGELIDSVTVASTVGMDVGPSRFPKRELTTE